MRADPADKARSHNQKVQEKRCSLTVEEQLEQEKREQQTSAIKEKLNKAATKRVDPSEKAREHNKRVEERRYSMTAEEYRE